MTHFTALESEGVGLIAYGQPQTVYDLILHARELGQETAMLMTEAGMMFVATGCEWTLREVRRAGS